MNDNLNKLRKAADKLGSDLDAERAWKRFEGRNRKERKKFFPWWMFGLFCIILTFTFFLNYNMGNITEEHSLSSDQLSREKLGEVAEVHRVKEITADKTDIAETLREKSDEKSSSNNRTREIDIQKVTKENGKRSYQANAKQINSDSDRIIAERRKKRMELMSEQTPLSRSRSVFVLDYNSPNPEVNKSVREAKRNTSIDQSNPITEIQPIDPLLHYPLGLSSSKPEIKCLLSFVEYPKSETLSTFKDDESKWSVGLQYTYATTSRETDWSNNSFNQRRLENETLKENNVAEVLATRTIGSSFSLSSGLTLNQYRSSLFEVDQKLVNETFEYVVVEQLVRNGEVELVYGPAVGTSTKITERVRQQKFRSLSIPLYFNYDSGITDKLSIQFSGGVNYSLINRAVGVTFASAVSQGEYQSLNDLYYRRRGQVEGVINLSLHMHFSKALSLTLGTRYMHDLNGRRLSSQDNEMLSSYGLSLGLQRKL